ncbi:MAG: nucleotidyltransferase domain-containing protein [Elusimicrobia bacterium]|nr:nucleotidyltransferase domain-containing protein [Elusimicrobiota bacterium]
MCNASHRASVEIIRESFPDVIAVYIYGSRARGEAQADSDLDLALLLPMERTASTLDVLNVQSRLELITGCPVEISVLDPGSLVHAKEVVCGGRVLYSGDSIARLTFEMQMLSAYARLCEDRAPVLAAYSSEASHG